MTSKVMRRKEEQKKHNQDPLLQKQSRETLPWAACKTEDFNSFLTLILDFCSETHNSKTNGVESFHQLQLQHNSNLKKKIKKKKSHF